MVVHDKKPYWSLSQLYINNILFIVAFDIGLKLYPKRIEMSLWGEKKLYFCENKTNINYSTENRTLIAIKNMLELFIYVFCLTWDHSLFELNSPPYNLMGLIPLDTEWPWPPEEHSEQGTLCTKLTLHLLTTLTSSTWMQRSYQSQLWA